MKSDHEKNREYKKKRMGKVKIMVKKKTLEKRWSRFPFIKRYDKIKTSLSVYLFLIKVEAVQVGYEKVIVEHQSLKS